MKIYYDSPYSIFSTRLELNDIISDLMENARIFGHRFVSKASLADIIITNSIFNKDIINLNIPKIKIMDSLIYDENLYYNDQENIKALEIADHVIFTSKSIKDHVFKLYPELKIKKTTTILRISNSKIFKTTDNIAPDISTVISVAKDWGLKENRIDMLLDFFSTIPQKVYLLGKCNIELPENIIKIDSFDDNMLNQMISESQILIDISYKQFSSPYVSKAVAAGIPVIYTNSGGLSEIVEYGEVVEDDKEISLYDSIPEINKMDIMRAYNNIRSNFKNLYHKNKKNHLAMVINYFTIITEYEKK